MAVTDQLQFFLRGAKTQEISLVNCACASGCGCASDFFKDITEMQNGRQKSTLNFFVGAKTFKLNVRNYSNFGVTFPTIWRCAGDFFKVLLKFKMSTTDQQSIFLKLQKLKVLNYSNFTITFPTIWRCACDIFKVVRKFKMAAMHGLHNFLWAQKLYE